MGAGRGFHGGRIGVSMGAGLEGSGGLCVGSGGLCVPAQASHKWKDTSLCLDVCMEGT